MTDSKGFFLPVKAGEEEGGNNGCKGLQLYVDEEKMITVIRLDKQHNFSKAVVLNDLMNNFKDLDEDGAKEVVEKFWDSEEVNS